jgi:thiaminase
MQKDSDGTDNFRGGFIDWLLKQEDVKKVWHDYTTHEFVRQLSTGELPLYKFKNYLIQGKCYSYVEDKY